MLWKASRHQAAEGNGRSFFTKAKTSMDIQEFKVVVTEVPPTEIVTCGVLMWIGVKGVDEGAFIHRYLQENLPCMLIDGVDRSRAEFLRDALEAACGEARVDPSACETPVVLWPCINEVYEERRIFWQRHIVARKNDGK